MTRADVRWSPTIGSAVDRRECGLGRSRRIRMSLRSRAWPRSVTAHSTGSSSEPRQWSSCTDGSRCRCRSRFVCRVGRSGGRSSPARLRSRRCFGSPAGSTPRHGSLGPEPRRSGPICPCSHRANARCSTVPSRPATSPRRITLMELAQECHRSKAAVSQALALVEKKLLESVVRGPLL